MYVLVTGRRLGKTYLTCRWFLEDPEHRAVIVGTNADIGWFWRGLHHHAPNLPEHYRSHIITADEAYKLRGSRIREFAVENAEELLASHLGIHIGQLELVTMTGTLLNPALGAHMRDEERLHEEMKKPAARFELSPELVEVLKSMPSGPSALLAKERKSDGEA